MRAGQRIRSNPDIVANGEDPYPSPVRPDAGLERRRRPELAPSAVAAHPNEIVTGAVREREHRFRPDAE